MRSSGSTSLKMSVPCGPRVHVAHFGRETDATLLRAVQHDLFETGEGATADEEDVRGVDLQEFLLRMLAATLRRHRGDRAFDELEQRLLHALARHVARDGRVVGLAGNLVDFVDVDDTGLRLLDVVVALLKELLDDVLDVLADVAGFGQRRRVGDGERHVEQTRERLGQQSLAAARGADQQDVALRNLDIVLAATGGAATGLQTLVVVVHSHRQSLLRALLADDVFVEDLLDLGGLGKFVARAFGAIFELFTNDVVTELDAFVADKNRWTGNQLTNFVLTLAAERAVQQLSVVMPSASVLGHRRSVWRLQATPACFGNLYITASARNPRGVQAEAVVYTGFVENCEWLNTAGRLDAGGQLN